MKKLASCIICICLSFLQDKSLYHPVSNSCIDSSPSERRVFMNTCDPASLSQLWLFERTNATVLEHFNQGTNWAYWTVRWHVFQKERSWLKGHLCSSESFWGKRCLILFWNGQITLLLISHTVTVVAWRLVKLLVVHFRVYFYVKSGPCLADKHKTPYRVVCVASSSYVCSQHNRCKATGSRLTTEGKHAHKS